MSAKVFVGNLNYETTKEQLEALFSQVGEVKDIYLPSDRATGKPRGFAFVEFSDPEGAQAALEKFNDFEVAGRKLRVDKAADRPRRPPGAFSPGFNSQGSGGGGGGGGYQGKPPAKPKGSRRGMRGRKRSL